MANKQTGILSYPQIFGENIKGLLDFVLPNNFYGNEINLVSSADPREQFQSAAELLNESKETDPEFYDKIRSSLHDSARTFADAPIQTGSQFIQDTVRDTATSVGRFFSKSLEERLAEEYPDLNIGDLTANQINNTKQGQIGDAMVVSETAAALLGGAGSVAGAIRRSIPEEYDPVITGADDYDPTVGDYWPGEPQTWEEVNLRNLQGLLNEAEMQGAEVTWGGPDADADVGAPDPWDGVGLDNNPRPATVADVDGNLNLNLGWADRPNPEWQGLADEWQGLGDDDYGPDLVPHGDIDMAGEGWEVIDDDEVALIQFHETETEPHEAWETQFQYPMTGNEINPTYLNDDLSSVFSSNSQREFASAKEAMAFLRTKGVTQNELDAKGITSAVLEDQSRVLAPNSKKTDISFLDDPYFLGSPFTVSILKGDKTQYSEHFLKGGDDYTETVVSMIPKAGQLEGSRAHYSDIPSTGVGETVFHIRTALFPVEGTRMGEALGYSNEKTFHLGEIQSDASSADRHINKARSFLEGEKENIARLELMDTTYQAQADYVNSLIDNMPVSFLHSRPSPENEFFSLALDEAKNSANSAIDKQKDELFEKIASESLSDDSPSDLRRKIEAMYNGIRDLRGESARMGIDMASRLTGNTEEVVRVRGNLERSFSPQKIKNTLEGLSSGAQKSTSKDQGLGNILSTNKVTNMGIKQAFDQLVTEYDKGNGVGYFTVNTGDLAKRTTYGDLEGQEYYYDNIVPRQINEVLRKLANESGLEMPELVDVPIKVNHWDEDVGSMLSASVKGFKVTPEFIQAIKEGAMKSFKRGGIVNGLYN